jgi:hypothetical protein
VVERLVSSALRPGALAAPPTDSAADRQSFAEKDGESCQLYLFRDHTNPCEVNRLLAIATRPPLHHWAQAVRLRTVHAAGPTNTPVPTQHSAPAVAPLAGAATQPVTAPLAVSPNSEPARAVPTPLPPTVPVVPMARLVRAPAKVNVAAPPDTVETTRVSAVLAANLSSEIVNHLHRTSRLTAPAALMAKLVLASAKEVAVALLDTAGLAAIFVALAASQASELVTMQLRTSRQTASAGRMAKRARDPPKVNVAARLGTAGLETTSAAPAVSQASGRVTPTLEVSRPTASAARTARRAKDMPRESVAARQDSAEQETTSATQVASQASGRVTAAQGPSQQTANVGRTARAVKDSPRESVARPQDIVEKTLPFAVQVASPPLARATAAPEAFRLMVHVARTVRLAKDMPRVSVVLPLAIAEQTRPSAALAASPPSAHATAAPEASAPTEIAAARTARRARALLRGSAAVQTATVAVPPTTALLAARARSACATPVPALSQLMEHAAAKMVESAKALRREIVAAQTATAALRLTTVVPDARMHSESAAAVRAPSQRMETALRTGRPARARLLETAAALPITAAIRPLIAALDGKWTIV